MKIDLLDGCDSYKRIAQFPVQAQIGRKSIAVHVESCRERVEIQYG